jgi:uncharacterized membrane protein
MKWFLIALGVMFIVIGAMFIMMGILRKRGATEQERELAQSLRHRRQGVVSDFRRPFSEREMAVARIDVYLFLLSPLGAITAGAILVLAGVIAIIS